MASLPGLSPLQRIPLRQLTWPIIGLVSLGMIAMQAEPTLFLTLNQWCSTLPDLTWVVLSLLGNGWVVATLLLPSVERYPQAFFAALMTAPWTGIVADLSKRLFSTPRPPSVLEADTFHLIGEVHLQSSMPSGHTLTAFAVAVGLAVLPGTPFARHLGKLLLLAGLVGLSRIGMGVHWPEDVLVGAAIGGLNGLLAAALTYHYFPSRWLALPASGLCAEPERAPRIARVWGVIALLPALALFFLDEDRGLAPGLRYALAAMAFAYSLRWLAQSLRRHTAT